MLLLLNRPHPFSPFFLDNKTLNLMILFPSGKVMDLKSRVDSNFPLSIATMPFLLPGINVRHSNMKDSGQGDMVEAPQGILWKGFLLLKERHMETVSSSAGHCHISKLHWGQRKPFCKGREVKIKYLSFLFFFFKIK